MGYYRSSTTIRQRSEHRNGRCQIGAMRDLLCALELTQPLAEATMSFHLLPPFSKLSGLSHLVNMMNRGSAGYFSSCEPLAAHD